MLVLCEYKVVNNRTSTVMIEARSAETVAEDFREAMLKLRMKWDAVFQLNAAKRGSAASMIFDAPAWPRPPLSPKLVRYISERGDVA